ncbi:peptidase domain-containing ABC transporter [Flammeovirga pectinis]|uniref:Peptidase domain-containing ABC transporter n=1 Tax=Flammeovirga pectinis TaxID=2494373 RepID=A0A3S9P6B7_9BACT|nr:peptidase domain-containing ABC transporter [Flammeovirga pectinis]AZQ63751.1 peptidase domain-containing ABC transporter [Flammeovirga pectinis]
MLKRFPFFKQLDAMDCGPASLKIISKYYGKNFSMKYLRDKCNITREGVSLLSISKTSESLGFKTLGLKTTFEDLKDKLLLPCIIHWEYKHFVVVYKITLKKIYISDPQLGLVTYNIKEFCKGWKRNEERGIVLTLEPTSEFFKQDPIETTSNINKYWRYLKPYKFLIFQSFLGMIVSVVISLFFPMISQSIIDIGIFTNDLDFINILLVASLVLTLSSVISEYFQNRLMLYIGDKTNISMVSDFISKLLKLPLKFFEKKMVSDVLSRIRDHVRIQNFIIESLLGLSISVLSIIIYGIILFFYDTTLLAVFFIATILYISWVALFLSKRRMLDYKQFDANIENQSEILEIFNSIEDIKINNIQQKKKWDWEKSRLDIYILNLKALNLNELQRIGTVIIDRVKNIVLTFIAAKSVMTGEMSLGMMLSVQYIIGQLNGPVGRILSFIQNFQEAKISMERVSEINFEEEEEKVFEGIEMPIPNESPINLVDASFKYIPNGPYILNNINLTIPYGKVTAIVGCSGSGKSTLLKILLRFYELTSGSINIGNTELKSVNIEKWRSLCGSVLQDGKIFSGTILENIILTEENINIERLNYAIKSSNILEMIETFPLKLYTVIGESGQNISGGQKQRILIARSLYKNPSYLFLDEATNSLDAKNEKEISDNILQFTLGRTSVIVAHRLSTIMNADQIVVLDKGEVIELGTHSELLQSQGKYYELVKDQVFEENINII